MLFCFENLTVPPASRVWFWYLCFLLYQQTAKTRLANHEKSKTELPLDALGLLARVLKVLQKYTPITLLQDLLQYTGGDLWGFKGLGEKAIEEIEREVFEVYNSTE